LQQQWKRVEDHTRRHFWSPLPVDRYSSHNFVRIYKS
jgi:hypothetical protein